ncbi:polysaccharide lyase 6 family protein [Paradesertivirga mongoliensis]|uniref:Polysaccharide lyase 6 family protein n=1 Tax=Paradesertivirga mongoliensis TaxID=2100740 RepID=A0ABW4ZK69_9SPHI|nr:polysaccharide lyase 6 family protein [Pedobacter mongoliensis]
MNRKRITTRTLLFSLPCVVLFSFCKKSAAPPSVEGQNYANSVNIGVSNEMPLIGSTVTLSAVYTGKIDKLIWTVDNAVIASADQALNYTFKDLQEHTFKISIEAGPNKFTSAKTIKAMAGSADNEINKNLIPPAGTLRYCTTWLEFTAAVNSSLPGDVIQLKDGTYSGNLAISKSGTSGKPITIIPQNRGGVIIGGNSEWEINGKYITVDGFYFARGSSTHPISFGSTSAYSRLVNSAIVEWNLGGADTRLITIKGNHNEVGYCFLRKKNTPGMMLEVVRESSARNDHLIHHVYFGYFKDPGSGNGFETVRISTSGQSLSGSYTTLENCVFERCDGESEILSNKSGFNRYRGNTFLNSDGALTLRHGHDCLVENNFFINTSQGSSSRCNGVRVIGERQIVRNNYFLNLPSGSQAIQLEYGNEVPHALTQYDQVKDAVIENNTVYNCDKGIRIGASRNSSDNPPRILAPNGIFKNNLIVSANGSNYSLELEDEVVNNNLFTYSNNLIAGKNRLRPVAANLPAGIQYTPTLQMTVDNNGLYWPADQQVTAGSSNMVKPLYQDDVVPYWIKIKMTEKHPDFSGIPW